MALSKGAPPLATARFGFVQPRTGMYRKGPPRSLPLATAGAVICAAAAATVGYVRWRTRYEPHRAAQDIAGAASEPVLETSAAVSSGYQEASLGERAAFNLLASFTITSGVTRIVAYVWDQRRRIRPLARIAPSGKEELRVHHFVPGVTLVFASGGGAIVAPRTRWAPWLGVPFGVGAAMALDEGPRLMGQDLYWSRENLLFAQGFAGLAGTLVCGARIVRRGADERRATKAAQ